MEVAATLATICPTVHAAACLDYKEMQAVLPQSVLFLIVLLSLEHFTAGGGTIIAAVLTTKYMRLNTRITQKRPMTASARYAPNKGVMYTCQAVHGRTSRIVLNGK